MTININPDDVKLFEENGFTKEQVGATVNHYREQGLSDDDIQLRMNDKLNQFRNKSDDVMNTPLVEDIQLNEDGTRKKVLQGGISYNPSFLERMGKGVIKGLSSLGTRLGKNVVNKQIRPLLGKQPLTDEQLDKAYGFLDDKPEGVAENIGAFAGQVAPYTLLPQIGAGQGLGQAALNAAAQGGLIGGIESVANNGVGVQNLTDAGIGAGIGGALPPVLQGGGILAGKIANNPAVQNFTGKTLEALTSVPKKYIDRALKAELGGKSILGGKFNPETAYQPVEQKLRQALNTLPSKETYAKRYSDLAKRAKQGIDKKLLEKNVELNTVIKNMPESASDISALRESIDEGLDKFRFGDVNPALEEAGGVINNAKRQLGYKSQDEVNEALQNYVNKYKSEIGLGTLDKEAEDIAFNVLAQATGKNKNWLKSQLKAELPKMSTQKRQEFIQNLLEFTDDKIKNIDPTWMQKFPDVNWNNLQGTTDGGYKVAHDMFDRIMGRNFRKNLSANPLEQLGDELNEGYANILSNLAKNPNEAGYSQAMSDLERLLSGYDNNLVGQTGKDFYYNKLIQDMDAIDNIVNPKVQPATLHGIKEQLYDRANFNGDMFGNYGNSGIKSVAQDINQYLRNQNPAYAGINDELKLLNSVKYDLGGPAGINQNTLAGKLKGIGSEANTLSNMDDRLRNLNTLLDDEYKFYNDAANLAKTQNAQKELEQLVGGRQLQRNPRLLGNINDIARQQALEDLQAQTGVNFMDELENIQAREALDRLFPGQGGGSGSAQGFGNLLRTSIIGGAPTAAAITHNPLALAGLGLISPKITGQGTIRAFGALNNLGNMEVNPGLYNLLLQGVGRTVGGEK